MFFSTVINTMTSKAEIEAQIEAQIEALKKKLKESEMDTDFTPMELVRWDPSLIGAVLHLKYHDESIIRKSLRTVWNFGGEHWIVKTNSPIGLKINNHLNTNNIEEQPLHKIGILSKKGMICLNEDFYGAFHTYEGYKESSNHNTFDSLSEMSLWIANYRGTEGGDHRPEFKAYTSQQWSEGIQIDTTQTKIQHGTAPEPNSHWKWHRADIKLTKPDDNLLDKIQIVKVVKLPFQDKEVIIDLYPLSSLYKEWKADKDAGKRQRNMKKTDDALVTVVLPTVKKEHNERCDCVMCIATKGHP